MITLTIENDANVDLQKVCTYFQIWALDYPNLDFNVELVTNEDEYVANIYYNRLNLPSYIRDFFDDVKECGLFSMLEIETFFKKAKISIKSTFSYTHLGLLKDFLADYQLNDPIFTW